MNESERKDLFRKNPMLQEFLAIMLEDAQFRERDEACVEERGERDTGTVYSCPDETLDSTLQIVESFQNVLKRMTTLWDMVEESSFAKAAGCDLYLELFGHGAGFADRDCWSNHKGENQLIAEALSRSADAVRKQFFNSGFLETYIGDDGELYIAGMAV